MVPGERRVSRGNALRKMSLPHSTVKVPQVTALRGRCAILRRSEWRRPYGISQIQMRPIRDPEKACLHLLSTSLTQISSRDGNFPRTRTAFQSYSYICNPSEKPSQNLPKMHTWVGTLDLPMTFRKADTFPITQYVDLMKVPWKQRGNKTREHHLQ